MKFSVLEKTKTALRSALADFEPELVSGADAARLLQIFAEIEKLAAGGRLLAARRVEASNVWRRSGHRSAAAHIAEATGRGMGSAINALEVARQLGSLPATEEAVREGRLSEAQVREIAGASILQPEAEVGLVKVAEEQPLNVLKLRCRRVRATGPDQLATYESIRRARYLRNWIERDGAVRFDARLTPDEGARLLATVRAEAERLAANAKRAGVDESRKALEADALVRLACGGGARAVPDQPSESGVPQRAESATMRHGQRATGQAEVKGRGHQPSQEPTVGTSAGPTTMVHVRVDHAALQRGHLELGELCEIPGIGPIPIETARSLAVDSILSVLVTDGVDVTAVAHAGRTIPSSLRRALQERDETCVVPGCSNRDDLEIDHVEPFGQGGPTRLSNLVRLCHWHHYLKSHHRYLLERTEGGWELLPPAGSVEPPPFEPE